MFGFNGKRKLSQSQYASAVGKAAELISRTRGAYEQHTGSDLVHGDTKGLSFVEAQLLALALYLNLIDFCIQDTLYDDQTSNFLRQVKPKDLTHRQHREAIGLVFKEFHPPARLNINMRYRYMVEKRLFTEEEASLFNRFLLYTNTLLDRHFYEHNASHHLNTDWLLFNQQLADGRGVSAFGALSTF